MMPEILRHFGPIINTKNQGQVEGHSNISLGDSVSGFLALKAWYFRKLISM